ncbi:unnamed protein product [Microthlaspi erraticum]|uniref:Uncharacterized protein n=1 Tax=Microthlaspi erraticum TaxID=1685480 RepID=A0A6D2J8A5_9BRAS|nr:unnamed protein product [Microthlaspi erraticum]
MSIIRINTALLGSSESTTRLRASLPHSSSLPLSERFSSTWRLYSLQPSQLLRLRRFQTYTPSFTQISLTVSIFLAYYICISQLPPKPAFFLRLSIGFSKFIFTPTQVFQCSFLKNSHFPYSPPDSNYCALALPKCKICPVQDISDKLGQRVTPVLRLDTNMQISTENYNTLHSDSSS